MFENGTQHPPIRASRTIWLDDLDVRRKFLHLPFLQKCPEYGLSSTYHHISSTQIAQYHECSIEAVSLVSIITSSRAVSSPETLFSATASPTTSKSWQKRHLKALYSHTNTTHSDEFSAERHYSKLLN